MVYTEGPHSQSSGQMVPAWGAARHLVRKPLHSFLEVHDELTRLWNAPYSACLRTFTSSALPFADDAEEKGYKKLPLLDESVATHLCPTTAMGWKAKLSHLSKPC